MKGTHLSWKSVCAPLGRGLDSPGMVASPEKLLSSSACPVRAQCLVAGARAQRLNQHACATWGGPSPLFPLPQHFPEKAAWLAGVGCESRPWDVGGSLGLEGEAAGL